MSSSLNGWASLGWPHLGRGWRPRCAQSVLGISGEGSKRDCVTRPCHTGGPGFQTWESQRCKRHLDASTELLLPTMLHVASDCPSVVPALNSHSCPQLCLTWLCISEAHCVLCAVFRLQGTCFIFVLQYSTVGQIQNLHTELHPKPIFIFETRSCWVA